MSESYSIPHPGDGESYEMSNLPISHLTPEITENNARQTVRDQDDLQLRRIGKIPSLQRNFDAISLVGLNCIILVTWECIVMNFYQVVQNGGPAGFFSAYFLSWIGSLCSITVLGELVSMAPISGGQYHWCAMLSPLKYMRFLSYITVCITALAWQMLVCDYCSVVAKFIQTMIQFAHSTYQSQIWQTYLFGVFIHALAYILNVTSGRMLPRLQVLAFTVHILGFFGILIPLSFMPEHREAHEVFAPYISIDPERFPSPAFSWIGGALFYNGLFMGGDCAVHLAEEAERATAILGPTMIISIFIDGLLAFGMTIALLFNKQTVQEIIAGEVFWPEMLFYETTKSRAATMIMSCVWVVPFMGAVLASIGPASRQLWSLSRDRGIPGWYIWKNVSSNKLPTNSITLVIILSLLISLLQFQTGSYSIWYNFISTAGPLWCISHTIIGSLLLYRRWKGQIHPYGSIDDSRINAPGAKLVWGPFRAPGVWGILINFFSVFYNVLIIIFSSYPWNSPRSMNLFVRILSMPTGICAIIILSISAYYFAWARHYWKGPIVETSI